MHGVRSVVQITFLKVQTGGALVMVLGSEFHIECMEVEMVSDGTILLDIFKYKTRSDLIIWAA